MFWFFITFWVYSVYEFKIGLLLLVILHWTIWSNFNILLLKLDSKVKSNYRFMLAVTNLDSEKILFVLIMFKVQNKATHLLLKKKRENWKKPPSKSIRCIHSFFHNTAINANSNCSLLIATFQNILVCQLVIAFQKVFIMLQIAKCD